MAKKIIFQLHSDDVINFFKSGNIRIEFNSKANVTKKLCIIYFSSNEIYYPNTSSAFSYSIIDRDRYEWTKYKFNGAFKHIFVRDIRKQWYVGGINSIIDTTEKLLEFLKCETKGFMVYTLGSSAGGYASILFGSLLYANRIYAFNPQLNLFKTISQSNYFRDPLLFNYKDDSLYNKYYDLSPFIIQSTNIFYFQSYQSKQDIDQYNSISPEAKANLNTIRFQTSNHGFPFLRINIHNVLSFEKDELINMKNKIFHPFLFSIHLVGIFETIQFIFKAIFLRFKKKLIEFQNYYFN